MYLLKLGNKYVSGATGSLTPHQRLAFRFPDDVVAFAKLMFGYLRVADGYRFVKLKTKADVVPGAAAALRRDADDYDDYSDGGF